MKNDIEQASKRIATRLVTYAGIFLLVLISSACVWEIFAAVPGETPAASCKALVQRANGQGRQAEIVTFANAYHDFDHPDLPLKTHKGLAFTAGGQGIARAGTNPEGRAAVLELVPKLLAQYLLRSPDN